MTSYDVRRSAANPILHVSTAPSLGGNITGPSLIRVPEWVEHALGRYYLYFAHHAGDSIRLAYADDLEGPWTIHPPGALTLERSAFPVDPELTEELIALNERLLGGLYAHIASPDVHVVDEDREIRLYYHGLDHAAVQRTRVARSADGRHFTPRAATLCGAYLRAFRHDGCWYGVVMPGRIVRSSDGLTPFERGPEVLPDDTRHTAVRVQHGRLEIFFTTAGDSPERIKRVTVDVRGDWMMWVAGEPEEVLAPEEDYEGAALPVEASERGAVMVASRQLRDPALFEEHGRTWLLYSVAGEQGIALVELVNRDNTIA